MIRNINNSISNSPIGPVVKPLVSGATHDIMGNSLGPTVTEIVVETVTTAYYTSSILWVVNVGGLTTSNSFELGGANYTPTAVSVLYVNPGGGQGNHTYLALTATNNAGGDGIGGGLDGEDLAETLGIRISGSGGSEDFYPLVIGAGGDFEWNQGGPHNQVILRLNVGRELDPWLSGSTTYGNFSSAGLTDELTFSLLT